MAVVNEVQARALLRRQFLGEDPLTPEEAEALRDFVGQHPEMRARYDRLVAIERALEGSNVPRSQLDRMLDAGPPPAAPTRLQTLTPAIAVLAAAAAVALVALPRDDGFNARGGGTKDRAAWVSVFKASSDKAPIRPLGETMKKGDALLFSYTNAQGSPYRFLAVVGLDAQGRAHWFHPAYENEADRPKSVAIDKAVADVELGARVFVDPAPGRMRLCGVFSVEAVDVVAADRELEAKKAWPKDARLDCHDVEVKP